MSYTSVTLNDRTKATLRWTDGRCKVTFQATNKSVVLPVGIDVTVNLVQKLYAVYAK